MSDNSTRHPTERVHRELLEKLYEKTNLTPFELMRNFPVFAPRTNIARFLSHYEIFKRVAAVPGAIMDVGVFRGASTFTWAKLCEIFCPTDARKVVYAFDTFAGFPSLSKKDGKLDLRQDKRIGGYAAGRTIVADLVLANRALMIDKHLRDIPRIEFVKGDVSKTVPKFVKRHRDGLRIALLNLDADLYEPTMACLEHFVPLMSRGGIIVVDEYAVEPYGGESDAVDEYFRKKFGRRPVIQKFTWHTNPTGFIEVDW